MGIKNPDKYLKEVINILDTINGNYYEYVYEDETESSKLAHKLGLRSIGWAYWADQSGTPVAKTVDGQLVKLTPDDKKKSLDNHITQRQQKKAQSHQLQEPIQQEPTQYKSVVENPHYNPVFYSDNFDTLQEDVNTFVNSIQHINNYEEKVVALQEFIRKRFNISPDVKYLNDIESEEEIYKYDKDMFFKGFISMTRGIYNPQNKTIALENSNKSQGILNDPNFLNNARKAVNKFLKSQSMPETDDEIDIQEQTTYIINNAIENFHSLIHESIHAKDPYIEEYMVDDTFDLPKAFDMFLVEGLTEYKTKQLSWKMLTNEPLPEDIKYLPCFSYRVETKYFDTLEHLSPGITKELWNDVSTVGRYTKISNVIKTSLLKKIEQFKNNNFVKNPETYDKIAHYIKHKNWSKNLRTSGELEEFNEIIDEDHLSPWDLIPRLSEFLSSNTEKDMYKGLFYPSEK